MARLGLCCLFLKEPLKFRHLRAVDIKKLDMEKRLERISSICLHNAETLRNAVSAVLRLGIKSFRVQSQLLPLFTHPEFGYCLDDLPDHAKIADFLKDIRKFSRKNGIRLSFHPDQFVVLASPHPKVVENSIDELKYQAEIAELIGADIINIHIGGSYGNKVETLERFIDNLKIVPANVKKLLTLENDDLQYTPSDLFPVCRKSGIPMVYDIHHHRCNPDGITVEEATKISQDIWAITGREPYFHVSSPKYGWKSKKIRPHADYIDIADFPDCWKNINATIDVEAKAKELAVLKLAKDLIVF